MASLADALVRQLLSGRFIASLATENPDGSIHMVAVWFWFDGSHVFVATSSRSRKARNLQSNPRLSLMIDSRDPAASCGITIAGTAQILTGDSSRQKNAEIHRKYLSAAALADPRVGPVFAGWDDLTIQITPASVIAWDMRVADRQFFGGAIEANPAYLLPPLH
jgi:PPOX class probable F420-dependent enzyme